MRIYPKSPEELERLRADYEFLGIDAYRDGDALVVGHRRKKQKKDKQENRRDSRKRTQER